MSRKANSTTTSSVPGVRCAIYTRKSTEEGLEQEFNSLDAQRESAEAYVKSQQHEGWTCLPDRYDDGGFTGGNMERPALRRLMTDIEAGRIDCVVVYKVDRLSRSLTISNRDSEWFALRKLKPLVSVKHGRTRYWLESPKPREWNRLEAKKLKDSIGNNTRFTLYIYS